MRDCCGEAVARNERPEPSGCAAIIGGGRHQDGLRFGQVRQRPVGGHARCRVPQANRQNTPCSRSETLREFRIARGPMAVAQQFRIGVVGRFAEHEGSVQIDHFAGAFRAGSALHQHLVARAMASWIATSAPSQRAGSPVPLPSTAETAAAGCRVRWRGAARAASYCRRFPGVVSVTMSSMPYLSSTLGNSAGMNASAAVQRVVDDGAESFWDQARREQFSPRDPRAGKHGDHKQRDDGCPPHTRPSSDVAADCSARLRSA